MPTATLDDVDVRALLPRTLAREPAERIRHALGTPLTDAVPVAFDALDDLDAGAYWVIREVRVQVRVRASEPDPARAATAIAQAMAAAVAEVVLGGPSADAARFSGRAAYLAAYLRGRLAGAGDGWVFARLSALSALPPLEAMTAAARLLQVGMLEAVTALARSGGWERLVTGAAPGAAAQVWSALARSGPSDATPDGGAIAALAALRGRDPVAVSGRSVAHRRLLLLGRQARSAEITDADLRAVARLEPDGQDPSRPGGEEPGAAPGWSGAGDDAGASMPTLPGDAVGPEPGAPEPGRVSVLRCAGAVAFLLVADLADVLQTEDAAAWLLEPEPAAGEVRAAALAAVVGRGIGRDDIAVRLAAGVETAPEDDLQRLAEGVPRWAGMLAEEHPDDDAWFAPLQAVAPAVVPLARALARRFAAHLSGFSDAGLPYLAERVLPLGGSVRLTEDAALVDLPRPPLHVLLAMAGLDAFSCEVPWLDVPVLLTHEEADA